MPHVTHERRRTVRHMRYRALAVLALIVTGWSVAGCGGQSPTAAEPVGSDARAVAAAIADDVNAVAADIIDGKDLDTYAPSDLFVELAAALVPVRRALDADRTDGITFRFAFGAIPLIIEVTDDRGTYCVDYLDDGTAIAVVTAGVCGGDMSKVALVGSLFSGDRASVDTLLAGFNSSAYVPHVAALVHATAARSTVADRAAVLDALVDDAAGIADELLDWQFTVTNVDAGVLVQLSSDGGHACGFIPDVGGVAAVAGACPVDAVNHLAAFVVESRSDAYTYGDDADLDAHWERCTAGEVIACDQLYNTSPVGSLYELYGGTCGRRSVFVEQYCAERSDLTLNDTSMPGT